MNTNLIDTHAHLTWDSFEPDLDQVIERALRTGIKTVINVGADLESSKQALRLAQGKPFGETQGKQLGITFYSTIGAHPEVLRQAQDEQSTSESIRGYVEKLEEVYRINPGKVIAVGECGLDYHQEGLGGLGGLEKIKELQMRLFRAQIALAKKLNLPLIIHCRPSTNSGPSAWNDIFLPELQGTTGVFHSFTGSPTEANKALNLGYYLGFNCIVTYPKNEQLRQIIKDAPLEKLLTETDCPFLPPQSMRGSRNEPANVAEVIKVIAQVKGLPEEEVAEITLKNAGHLFRLASNQARMYNNL